MTDQPGSDGEQAAQLGTWAPRRLSQPIPQLHGGTAHIWKLSLADAEPPAGGHERSDRQRARPQQSVRAILRLLLGIYLERDPYSIEPIHARRGKPGVPEDLFFNVSHSGSLALLAFTRAGEVGVDVELTNRRAFDETALARRAFGAAEAARIEALGPSHRPREFLRAWVRHEAVLKLHGGGIGGPDAASIGHRPWIAELELGAGAVGALALELPPEAVRQWSLAPEAGHTADTLGIADE